MNVVVEQEDATIKGAIGDYWARVKAGDIGSLPAVLGLVVLCIVLAQCRACF